ncbi:MAG: hypothetical protein ABIO76_05320 [Ginsengibacter sp.]
MQNKIINQSKKVIALFFYIVSIGTGMCSAQLDLSTNYFKIHIDKKGFITGMKNIVATPVREFSPPDKPSPLLCLYNSKTNKYYLPQSAAYTSSKRELLLTYSNGSKANVLIETRNKKYFKFTLLSLSPRNDIDDIQWGSFYTNITNLFGEIIGTARDTSDAVNYAIGVLALNDITTGGTSNTIGDAAPFQYIIHSPDKKKFPLPSHLREGQLFPIGGDGISDVAFYSHPEEYYRILYGNTASVDNKGRIFITYHSMDRTENRNILFSLIPFLKTDEPNHQEVQAIPGVDFIGSSIALWGSPDSNALKEVIQNIVLSEGLPYPKVNGKWVKDPAMYIPDVLTSGNLFDSTISYVRQMGFKAIEAWDLPYFKVDRADEGYIDGKNFDTKPFHFTSGDKSHKEFTDISNSSGVLMGRHTITIALAPGTKDASPEPSENLCFQQKRILVKGISSTDSSIEVNDPSFLNEIASWEGHAEDLNIIKIGKELIYYLGVSKTPPYTLQKVKRGYWGTTASNHYENDTIYKLQVTLNYGYDGLIPNIYLQDSIAEYYADVSSINGIRFIDFDGQEFLFNNGHGYYSVKRFFKKLFSRASYHDIPYLRITGATLSEGSWHYQSIWNVGGGANMYDIKKRSWGIEGKDLRNVAYANYFPATFGSNFTPDSSSTVQQYENVAAISVGVGVTYMMNISQTSVESCPKKYEIFSTIKTWENARAANAFSREIKKQLADPGRQFHLEQMDNTTWKLFEVKDTGNHLLAILAREEGY